MATQNKRKLEALNKENCEEHTRTNLAHNSNVPRSQENYITQVSEESEGSVTKRLSEEFSRTENHILGALARLDDFFINPLLQDHSGTTPEASRHALGTSQGTNEDKSQNDPHPEAGFFHSQMTQNSGLEDGHDSKYNKYSKHLAILNYRVSDAKGEIDVFLTVHLKQKDVDWGVDGGNRACRFGKIWAWKLIHVNVNSNFCKSWTNGICKFDIRAEKNYKQCTFWTVKIPMAELIPTNFFRNCPQVKKLLIENLK